MRRAHREMARADRVLFVVDAGRRRTLWPAATRTLPHCQPTRRARWCSTRSTASAASRGSRPATLSQVHLSAVTGPGSTLLRPHLKDCVGFHPAGSGVLSARARHLEALRRARGARRGGAPAAERAARRRTGGAGTDRRAEAARRDHRRGDERRPARADLRQLLHRKVIRSQSAALEDHGVRVSNNGAVWKAQIEIVGSSGNRHVSAEM